MAFRSTDPVPRATSIANLQPWCFAIFSTNWPNAALGYSAGQACARKALQSGSVRPPFLATASAARANESPDNEK